jgi:hypothetical protein
MKPCWMLRKKKVFGRSVIAGAGVVQEDHVAGVFFVHRFGPINY